MQVLYGPPGDSSQTAWFTHLLDNPSTASQTVWLAPTQRKREWVTERFHQNKRHFPPRLHIFDEFTHILYKRFGGAHQLIDSMTAQLIMHTIVDNPELRDLLGHWFHHSPGTGFLREVIRQVDEFQRHGASDVNLAAIPDASDGIGILFQKLYEQYHLALESNGLIDMGKLQLELCGILSEQTTSNNLPWTHLILDGFLELTPLQLDILKELDSLLDITLIWSGTPQISGVYQWMTAGLKTVFPKASWTPLITWPESSTVEPTSLSLTLPVTSQAATSLSQVEPDSLPMDLKPVPNSSGVLRVIEAESIRNEIEQIARDIKRRLLGESFSHHQACPYNQQACPSNDKPVPSKHSNDKPVPPTLPGDIAITFPDLKVYAPIVRRIFHRFEIPVNIRQSLPLTGSPVFSALERILKLPGRWHASEVLSVVTDPLLTGWSSLQSQQAARKLMQWSTKYRIVRGFDQWSQGLQQAINDHNNSQPDHETAVELKKCLDTLEVVLTGADETRHLVQWLTWTRSLLVELQWNARLDKLQRSITFQSESGSAHFEFTRRAYNQFLIFFDSLERLLGNLDANYSGKIDLQEYRVLLPRLLSGVEYQLTTQEGDRVQVLGLLGIRGSTYKHVYFGGLTEDAFPSQNVISPFWSPELVDLLLERPAHSNRVQAIADLIRIMSVATETFTISYPTQSGDEVILPSPMWEYIRAVFSDNGMVIGAKASMHQVNTCEEQGQASESFPDHQLSHRDYLIALALASKSRNQDEGQGQACLSERAKPVFQEREISDSRKSGTGPWCTILSLENSEVAELLTKRVGPIQSFSPTKLENYLACPRKYFFEYILRLSEPEIPEDELSHLEKGNLIHTVLEKFYHDRIRAGNGRIAPEEILHCAEDIRRIARIEFEKLNTNSEVSRQQLVDILGRPELDDPGAAHRFAECEALISQELQPVELEWRFGQKHTAKELFLKDEQGQPLFLEGKIDRIDQCNDELVIWDYKTGKLPTVRDIDSMTRIQIGLYMLAVERVLNSKVTVAGYYRIPTREAPEQKPALRQASSMASSLFPQPKRSNSLDREWSTANLKEYLVQLESLIGAAVTAMRHGKFPAKPETTNCRLCRHSALCRVEKEQTS